MKSLVFIKPALLVAFYTTISLYLNAQSFGVDNKILSQNKHLKAVLKKYQNDPQKLDAAKFLIQNLPYHFGYQGDGVRHFKMLYELRSTGMPQDKVIDSVKEVCGPFNYDQLKKISDVDIDTALLIENIEYAFKAWREQPWGKNVAYDNFIEYVLPYRVGNEQLSFWRKSVYETFNPMLDSIRNRPEAGDPAYVAGVVLNILKKRRPFQFATSFYGPSVGPDIVKWHSGNCRESSDLFIFVCRALGIPCGRDMMFMRGDMNLGHDWNFVLDKNRENLFCSVTYASNQLEAASTYWNRKGKVYRETFSLNRDMQKRMLAYKGSVFPYFKEPLFKDVTSVYTGKWNHNISISCDSLYQKVENNKMLYLCVASWLNWVPVALNLSSGNRIGFPDVEGGIVFRLATYEGEHLQLISDPFLLDKETGSLRYFTGLNEEEEITVTHKYRLSYIYPDRMVKGVFEASNDPGFSTRDTLFVIRKKPVRLWNVVRLNTGKTYRYVRYVGPKGSYCNVAEVAFYGDADSTTALTGEMIGTPTTGANMKTHNYTNVYDGDPSTSFDYHLPDGGWAGLDLGDSKKITRIVYTARNFVNFIYPGNYYELFYAKQGEWISVDAVEATTDSLTFKVPKGALLYLKNHSGGKEERIFECQNGEQLFW
ncbi:hypothetical protein [Filimonas effusa]|uniref:Peptide-N(4)-(N-acetyl-beta-glucosaminyl)asparagine amidase n=1 Tax=Filimonas effusa TaxID=2508721 RepID=A0A4Q1D5Z1_9BACT|nr:hypothetical protein [Filimonas effusa]RXK83869.1 hypothetical protein ESB13_17520 [Filimonas effusa]